MPQTAWIVFGHRRASAMRDNGIKLRPEHKHPSDMPIIETNDKRTSWNV